MDGYPAYRGYLGAAVGGYLGFLSVMAKSLVFDTEANGLLKTVTKVHCIGAIDTDTHEQFSWGPHQLPEALETLYQADVLTAHFGISYDFPMLKKVMGWNPRPGCRRQDSVVMSRLLHSGIAKDDAARPGFPGKLVGSHKLKAWGLRLGEHKGDFEGPWDEWSQEMQDYMDQDVVVNHRLLQYLKPWEYPQGPFDLEHRVAEICFQIEQDGWPFDTKGAQELYVKLAQRRDELEASLKETFGSWEEVDRVFVPKRDNKTRGYVAGVPVTKYKTVTFNPGSRVHIERKLRELGWNPQDFTEGGRAKLDEGILVKIDIPEAKLIIEYLLIQKRLGQLADGDNGWLRVVGDDGKIHGSYNTLGTVTGRCTHHNPNVSQVPSVRAAYGKECKSLFYAPTGWKLIDADMSGLELRTFAHYLSNFDNGEYGKIVVDGDVHTFNQNAAKLPTRDNAKTMIYATLYSAGDEKLGKIVNGTRADGKRIRDLFNKAIPAYPKLKDAVTAGCKKGWLKGLDGRRLSIRSEHAALNVLLQSAGAILCKQWISDFSLAMESRGYQKGWNQDYVIVGFIHDAIDVCVKEHMVDEVGELIVTTAQRSGDPFGFKIRLDSSFSVGSSWADVH